MIRILVAVTFVGVGALSEVSDGTVLVQSRLVESRGTGGNASAASAASVVVEPPKRYRITYGATYGSDHTCLTEIAILDARRQPMQARFQEASSCYGCPVKCEDCSAEWGDATKQFDMVATSNEASAWSCTNIGSFRNGIGKPSVTFTLPSRPAKVIFNQAEVGEWAPKDWVMQEYQELTGKWETVATVSDAPKEAEQPFFVQYMGTAESPAQWPIDYAQCGGNSVEPVPVVPSVDPPTMATNFQAVEGANLASSGEFVFDNGHQVAIDGEFGTISVGTTVYEIRQVTFNFGSNRVGPDGNPAQGEMHIIMQKPGSLGIFDIAVVAILLQLKAEGAAEDATHDFFLNRLGLENLPPLGEPRPINGSLDLGVFAPLFQNSSAMTSDCSQYVPWYILDSPAWISGTIQQAFIQGPPAATPAPTFFNQTLANMTDEQKAMALYNAGMKPDGSPLISAEEQAVLDAGPSPDAAAINAGPVPSAAVSAGPVPSA